MIRNFKATEDSEGFLVAHDPDTGRRTKPVTDGSTVWPSSATAAAELGVTFKDVSRAINNGGMIRPGLIVRRAVPGDLGKTTTPQPKTGNTSTALLLLNAAIVVAKSGGNPAVVTLLEQCRAEIG